VGLKLNKMNSNTKDRIWTWVIIILIFGFFLLVSQNATAQLKKQYTQKDSIPTFLTSDTTLNNFMLHWLGKPGWHCGTYIGETMFVHAANKYEGVKISSLLEPRYKNAYKGAGRLKNKN